MSSPVNPMEDTWLMPEAVTPGALAQALTAAFQIQPLPEYRAAVTYVDSFDWRLYQAGMLLHTHGHSWTLYEQSGKITLLRGGPQCRTRCLLDDFPEGGMKERLTPVLGIRALLPLTRLTLHGCQWHLHDRTGRLVLRLVLEEQRLEMQGQVFRLARLFPLQGEELAREQARGILRQQGVVQPVSPLVGFEAGCRAAGRTPLDYCAKFPPTLSHELRDLSAFGALVRICRHLLDQIRRNMPGILGDLDPVFLRDFRVSVRRTRTALGMGKHVFPQEKLAFFKEGFAALGRAAGPVRDLDTLLLAEAHFLERLPPRLRPGLQAAFAELARERNRSRRALLCLLESRQCEQLLLDWEHFLEQGSASGMEAMQPVHDLADRMLDKLGRKVLAYGQVSADMPAKTMHSLRIACKKLRYALEFFRGLYPGKETESVIQSLKSVQSVLGHLHDASVQEQLIRDCLERLQEPSDSRAHPAPAIASLNALCRCLREEQRPYLERCAGDWANFIAQFQAFASLLEAREA